ncbi:MAG TPA: ABC transporter permease [Actinocrinis sp.]|nr:ABC transporter permease [Actinocrinis sp.]
MRPSLWRSLWPPALLAVAMILAWQAIALWVVRQPQDLPTPGAVFSAGWQQRSAVWESTQTTLRETLGGFALSLVVAWLLATAMDFSGPVRRAVYPWLIVSQTLPIIVIAPVFIIWFGFGLLPKLLLVALATFFPLTVSLGEGFAATDEDAMRLLRSMGASRWQAFVKVRVPGALPFFFTGLRVAITYAVGGAIFAEYAGAYDGLGIYIQQMQNGFRTDLVFAAVLVTSVLSVILFAATFAIERLVMPWRKHVRRSRYAPDRAGRY